MRVSVSYRGEDNPCVAGRLRDRLVDAYGDSNVFFDVDDIPMGVDLRDVIRGTLEDVDVVLAIIRSG
jgi:TIR domain